MNSDFNQFEQRKQDHIELALLQTNQASDASVLDTLTLWHEALPDINFKEISLTTTRFGRSVRTPFLISSMTAGHQAAVDINAHLLEAAQHHGWAMGVGSQRRELTDPNESRVWQQLRKHYPNVSLFSNLGIAQLITSSLDDVRRLTTALEAEALRLEAKTRKLISFSMFSKILGGKACIDQENLL